jgi:hypothetical protein
MLSTNQQTKFELHSETATITNFKLHSFNQPTLGEKIVFEFFSRHKDQLTTFKNAFDNLSFYGYFTQACLSRLINESLHPINLSESIGTIIEPSLCKEYYTRIREMELMFTQINFYSNQSNNTFELAEPDYQQSIDKSFGSTTCLIGTSTSLIGTTRFDKTKIIENKFLIGAMPTRYCIF